MIEDRLIICIASSWDYDPTSKHQIMKILSRRNQILWIDYHGTRRPEATLGDVRAACSALFRFAKGVRSVAPSITCLTPIVIPGARRPTLRRLHERLLVAQIRRAIRAVDANGERPVQVWTFAPDVAFLAGRFGEERFVYYCVDEYSQFEGFDPERVKAAERELMDRADVVVTTSGTLHAAKSARRRDVVLVRHGVDYDHFAAAWRKPRAVPPDVARLPRPLLGFFGLIHHWIDRELIAQVARLRPNYSFVLIGDARVDVTQLRALPNVHLLGRRPYELLPDYCAAFDAAMLPFVESEMTRNINPIKMYEYLAAGLPVISTRLPEAQRFAGPIQTVSGPEAFAQACDQMLAAHDRSTREAVSRSVRHESWESKVEFLSQKIMGHLVSREARASKSRESVVPSAPVRRETVEAIR